MHPILLKVGAFTVYAYGVMLALAFAVATWLAARTVRRLPVEHRAIAAEPLVDVVCLALLGGILGGRLFYVLLEWEFFRLAPQEVFAIWHGGLVWYGGLLGGGLAGWLAVRARRRSFLRVADQLAPFVTLGHAIGRVGCLLNGCCYGRPTDAWCGIVFPGQAAPVVPTQVFESLGLLGLYVVLRMLQRPAVLQAPGRVLGWYLASYAALRFFLEFARGDQAPWWMGLTLQQFISLAMLIIGLSLVRRRR